MRRMVLPEDTNQVEKMQMMENQTTSLCFDLIVDILRRSHNMNPTTFVLDVMGSYYPRALKHMKVTYLAIEESNSEFAIRLSANGERCLYAKEEGREYLQWLATVKTEVEWIHLRQIRKESVSFIVELLSMFPNLQTIVVKNCEVQEDLLKCVLSRSLNLLFFAKCSTSIDLANVFEKGSEVSIEKLRITGCSHSLIDGVLRRTKSAEVAVRRIEIGENLKEKHWGPSPELFWDRIVRFCRGFANVSVKIHVEDKLEVTSEIRKAAIAHWPRRVMILQKLGDVHHKAICMLQQ